MTAIQPFGTHDGKTVHAITLSGRSLSCQILTYGAAVRSLLTPDRNGTPVDVVLGLPDLAAYIRHTCYFGAVIGPVANRIAGAAFCLKGSTCTMTQNDGPNCNHSGAAGLNARNWTVEDLGASHVTLSCTHPDGCGGIPGDLRITVTYTLDDGALRMDYRAISRRTTLCNLTNHSYFNLNGHASGPITGHRITLYAHSFTPTDAASIPTGAIRSVAGTPMDLTRPTRVGAHIDDDWEQIRQAGGYDHNWVADLAEEPFRPVARAEGDRSGIVLTVCSDRPGVQFYTGNYIPDGLAGKDGAIYQRRQGFCLETQAFPDAPHHAEFPSIVLPAGEEWTSRTEFRFSVCGRENRPFPAE